MIQTSSYDEKGLLLQVSAGDEQAFRELFTAWSPKLYHFTLGLTGSPELAEDIVQDSFLKIWLRRDRLSEVEHFSSYLFRMARNQIVSGIRRKAMENLILDKRIGQPEPEAGVDEHLHIKLVKNVIEQAVQQLPEQQRRVWRLRRQEGLRIKEVAAALGISEVTVKRHLTQAQSTLRQVLETEFPFDAGILGILLAIGW